MRRWLTLPLPDLRRFLEAESAGEGATGHGAAQQIVAAHPRRLEDRLGRTQRAVQALQELLGPQAQRSVSLEVLPPQRVLAVSLDVPPGTELSWYDVAMRDLDAAAGGRPVLPPGGRYEHTIFTEGQGRATVHLPAEPPLPPGVSDAVRELHLPQRTAAVATHCGPHDDLDLTYAAVGAFAARNGLRSADLVEEVYLVGPRDTDQPDRWCTLVAWLLASEALNRRRRDKQVRRGWCASAAQTHTTLVIGGLGQLSASVAPVTAEAKSGCTPNCASRALMPK
ncbi:GyrI-like domain-containing protein [Streptomyces sp. 110]|uniref:GyrI-like domain-containing protein n=1 Tax=Streptomyces endocoffeicus TaxID=2898945 RepID=A0ABS1Q859_9ACTN|nr:GyrI-like domain-containing protein [Streptomyces endocoffeicus]MBL1120861.1 GyrI-like domain-containing protein [Streptomyces endocoffeicus]